MLTAMSTSLKSKKDCWVGFDLGATKMLATVYDSGFKSLGSKRRRTKGHEGVEVGQQRIVQTITRALDEAKVDRGRLGGIGVGCPGPLDLDRGILLEATNLGWEDVPLKETLEKAFGCPAVIANDVDLGVYGEYRFGAATGARCVVGVFPGTGIGGGCVYEGKILRGRTSSCFEIGHVQVMRDGPLCGCGQRGCLESVAGRLAVSALAAQAAYRGQAPHLRATAGTDLANMRSGVLAAAVAAGDTVIEQILTDAADHIGLAVSVLVSLLAPDVVVLGGGLVEAIPHLFVQRVGETARARVLPSLRESFRVESARLGDDAGVQGAAAWVREVIGDS